MDAPSRPDPDQLLARIHKEEAQARRGRLKIFFGASAGVGKTYAMLSAAHALQAQGVDVVVGVAETHGRSETQALLTGLAVLPQRLIAYRGHDLQEFDLDGALQRKPTLVLMDELAHSNVAGSRHPKRWQDVEELLAAGIDVWTTVNVQHLETLNDVVSGITGIQVRETIPEQLFDAADEVVLVDLSADDLLKRLKEGKVYMPQQAATAMRNFFRKGNLMALRELALRRTADRVDDEMQSYRRTQSVTSVWQTREGLLLCVGPGERCDKLISATARLAAQLDAPWHCVHVDTPRMQRLPEAARQRTLRFLKSAEEAGAQTATLAGNSLPAAIVKYAREHNLSRVVLGRDVGRLPRPWRRTLAEAVGAAGSDLDVLQIALPAAAGEPASPAPVARPPGMPHLPLVDTQPPPALAFRRYGMSVFMCAVAALAAAPLHTIFERSNIVMLFLLAVVIVAWCYGRGPAALAAFLSVAAFDFLYVAPRYSLSVSDMQYLITFAVMLTVGLLIGQLTAVLKWQARVATQREKRVGALYAMSRDLSGALMPAQVADIAARCLESEFSARSALLVADLDERLAWQASQYAGLSMSEVDTSIAQWAFSHVEAAGQGTHTLPASKILYVPLKAPMRTRGVLAVEPRDPTRLAEPEQRRLLDTCASLLAISLERIHYVHVAQDTTLQMESERLRNSLLAALSHDLRTPLAAMVGMAESLVVDKDPARQHEITQSMRETAHRMASQVNNLLDMARLQSGSVQLHRQWLPLEEAVGSALRALRGTLDPARVQTHLPPELPMLHVDPVLFERVLCNLLENAVKYTPAQGRIDIGATANGSRMAITIDDQGGGLPPQREEAIFQMFERGSRESTKAGVGLGLAICRAIVHAHSGAISGQTRQTGGARFIIDLPLQDPPDMSRLAQDGDLAHHG